jgi:hypothetical protein
MTHRGGLAFLIGMILCAAIVSPGICQDVRFDADVAPVLIDRCLDCHSGPKPKGKLDLSRKASASRVIVAKDVNASTLWQRVEAGEMPPKKPLSDKEKAILKAWIASGAAWGADPIDPFRVTTSKRAGYDWWALQPVKRQLPPTVKDKAWPRNPIDHFILAKLEAEGLTPSPEAASRTLVRRLHFDMTGLPPATKDLDDDPKAVVDRLLASPHYGERWARHWLDVVRFGESHGFEHDELRKNAWPYRDWVIDAFNKDMPFNEFARLQIAGDAFSKDDPSALVATGFLVAGGYDSVGQGQQSAAMKAVVRQDELEDIVGAIGQTYLGLTVQCARCHDHKFDPVRTEEYYRLTAAVAGVRHGERDVTTPAARLAFEKKQREAQVAIAAMQAELAVLEKPFRAKALADRKKGAGRDPVKLPNAVARWDFTKGGKDEVGGLEVKLHDGAKLGPDGLLLPGGKSYASTPPIAKATRARTLVATVKLSDITQRGGAAISLQTPDGATFDAIVFGEREPGRWIAGSNFFVRTQDFGGPAETETKPVHVAITYHADGTIAAYRNGAVYGKPYKVKAQQAFEANQAMLLFGLRHAPAGGAKHLAGTLLRAELYDRALTPEEVAASAGIASDYVTEEELARHLDAETKAKRAGLLARIAGAIANQPTPPTGKAYAVAPRTPDKTHLLIRGNPAQLGASLSPGGVASLKLPADFGADTASDAERRVKLAEWITDAKNPLFARVAVNRLWHYHFGAGLVDTPSDFGFNGGRPSHPELLDWLADEFVRSGYCVKQVHRLIVDSATYRQSSRFRADAAKLDAGNRWLWRKSPSRLEAEALRDSILAVAGELNLQRGGPGYQDFKLTIRGATHYYNPIESDDKSLYRRSIYRTWARSGRNGLLDAHDCPDPSTVAPRRALTTTPLQALALMNNAFVLRMSDRFADRLRREAGADAEMQIVRAIELAYGRRATKDEIARLRPLVAEHGLPVFCRAIFNSNEFVYVD